MDILGRLNSKTEIHKALKDLPKTLEDTYERILMGIHPLNRSIAHKTLQLLAVEDVPTLQGIAEAAVVDVDQCSFTTDNRLLHPTDLLEICSYLIAVDDYGQIGFAHYTVLEYLTSQRIQDGRAAMFKVSADEARVLGTVIRIIYLLNLPYDRLPSATEIFSLDEDGRNSLVEQVDQKFPFITDAVFSWDGDLGWGNILTNGPLSELVLRLLDAQEAHFQSFEEYNTIFGQVHVRCFFRPKLQTDAQSSMTLAYLCRLGLVEVAEVLLMRNLDSSILENRLEQRPEFHENYHHLLDVEGPPLQVAAMMGEIDMAKLLIRYGADVNASYGGWAILTSTLRSKENIYRYDDPNIVSLLLNAGASPNPAGVCKTPLQLAVNEDHQIEAVKLLLAAGAEVNAARSDDAVATDMEHRFATTTFRSDSTSLES